jgi:hypothetical protein
MALKFKIGATAYEALPTDVKKEYKQVGSDYQLDLDGYEDPDALKRAKDHEKEAARQAKAEAAAEKQRADKAEKEARELRDAGKSVDDAVKAKETEWQAKYDKDIAERDTKLTGLTTATINNHRKSIADTLANKISTSPELLGPRLMDRIEVEIDPATNTPKAFILDAAGKRTAGTVDDLEKEALKNPAYEGDGWRRCPSRSGRRQCPAVEPPRSRRCASEPCDHGTR